MIVVRLKGGLGNQMFQYAFGKGLASTLNTELKIDCSLLLDRARGQDHIYRDYDLSIFQIPERFTLSPKLLKAIYKARFSKVGKIVRHTLGNGMPVRKEQFFHVDERLLQNPTDVTIYDGWWQSERYFSHVKTEIMEAFRFKLDLLPNSLELFKHISQTNSICLNVRRTDFLNNPTLNVTDRNYFLRAADHMANKIDSPHFFIFSDDPDWCEEHLKLKYPMTVVHHNVKGWKFSNYLQLMINCKHYIIPNSSFAWWAIWLNQQNDIKVIAPKTWFNDQDINTKDLVPKEWTRL